MKMEALPAIVKVTAITSIAGDSNNRQPYLFVDKVVGGVNFCLGLRKDEIIGEYVPVSALNKDIRELTDHPSQVLAIFERDYNSNSTYETIRHVAKGVNLRKVHLPEEIIKAISLKNYKYAGKN